jgi:hypothetical protein
MNTIPVNLPAFRNVERSYTKTNTGGQIDFQRQLQNDKSITKQTTITKNEDGGATINVTRTGLNNNSKSVEKTFSNEQVDSFMDNLNTLGQKLAENPVTLPSGKIADGGFLLSISA